MASVLRMRKKKHNKNPSRKFKRASIKNTQTHNVHDKEKLIKYGVFIEIPQSTVTMQPAWKVRTH